MYLCRQRSMGNLFVGAVGFRKCCKNAPPRRLLGNAMCRQPAAQSLSYMAGLLGIPSLFAGASSVAKSSCSASAATTISIRGGYSVYKCYLAIGAGNVSAAIPPRPICAQRFPVRRGKARRGEERRERREGREGNRRHQGAEDRRGGQTVGREGRQTNVLIMLERPGSRNHYISNVWGAQATVEFIKALAWELSGSPRPSIRFRSRTGRGHYTAPCSFQTIIQDLRALGPEASADLQERCCKILLRAGLVSSRPGLPGTALSGPRFVLDPLNRGCA